MNQKPLMTSSESVRQMKRMKINPLSSLTAGSLVRALDNFEYGHLREAALLWDVIAERDDTLKSVKPKREKEVSQLGCQVLEVGESDDESAAHKEVLEGFWNNVQAVDAYDRNEKGGFTRLVRQMMSSVSFRYAAHHIVWQPKENGELRAIFEFVPLWLFENTTGSLRYLEKPFATEGQPLHPSEWMVTAGDGLMVACSIGYFAKRQTLNDWLIFSDKFSVPGVAGATTAAKDSPEGQAMKSAVQSFGNDWATVLYGVDDPSKLPIHLIQPNGNPSAMPQPALIERVDRKFAALYRGADLSSMSSESGEGTGASLQGDEKDILLNDDAEMIAETLAQVSRQVIEWHFGYGVEPRAKVELMVPMDEDGKFLLEASGQLADRGVKISVSRLLERLSIQAADDDEEALGKLSDESSEPPLGESELVENSQSPFEKLLVSARWKSFPESLGIPRAEMPQIKSGDRAAFLNFLKARGISSLPIMIDSAKLKPTQSDYSEEKVQRARDHKKSRRSILVSKDRYILDGHHQYVASLAEEGLLGVILIDAPIARLLSLASQMPASRTEKVANAEEPEESYLIEARTRVEDALGIDLAPVLEMMEEAVNTDDESVRDELLKKVSAVMDELEDGELVTAFEELLSSSLVNGWQAVEEEEVNS